MEWVNCSPESMRSYSQWADPPLWDSSCSAVICAPHDTLGRIASADVVAAVPPSAAAAVVPHRTALRSSGEPLEPDSIGGASWWAPGRQTSVAPPTDCAQSR